MTSPAGTVTVRYRSAEVEYLSAAPLPGWSVDVEQSSPEVRVEFRRDPAEVEVRVRWDDGGLDIDVKEN